MTITALPSAPLPTDTASEFNAKAFAWVAALGTFTTEVNAFGTTILGYSITASDAAATATTKAAEASASAANAAGAAGVTQWVSGTTYMAGNCVWSPSNYQTYRRKATGAGTTGATRGAGVSAMSGLSVLRTSIIELDLTGLNNRAPAPSPGSS